MNVLPRWIRTLFRQVRTRPIICRPRRTLPLYLEQLEDRVTPSVVTWTGAQDANWDNPNNWTNGVSTSVLPTANDDVVVNQAGANIVFNNTSGTPDTIKSFTATATGVSLTLQAGTLDVSGGGGKGAFQADQSGDSVLLQGGTLKGADVTAGTILTGAIYSNETLDGVQLDGTLDLGQTYSAGATILNGLVLNGQILIGGSTGSFDNLYFGTSSDTAGQTLSGTGSVIFGSSYFGSSLGNKSSYALTIGSGITIQGGQNSVLSGAIDNQGTIKEDTAGGSLSVNDSYYSPSWTNDGTIEASNGGILRLGGRGWVNNGSLTATGAFLTLDENWTNNGSISADATSTLCLGSPYVNLDPTTDPSAPYYAWTNAGSISHAPGATVNLGGVFQTSALAGLGLDAADIVNLTGTLDNRGATLALGSAATPSSWTLQGGRIYQGDVTTSPGADLIGGSYNNFGNTLDGVQLDGTLDLGHSDFSSATIINGMVLNGQILVGGSASSYDGLNFGTLCDTAGQTLSGTGSVIFGSSYYSNSVGNNSPYTLTIGSGITIQGGQNSVLSGAIDNQGSIKEDTAGGTLSVNDYYFGPSWTNDGTIAASNGGTVALGGQGWTNNGSLSATGATLNLDDSWTNNGSIAADATSTLGLGSPNVNLDPTTSYYAPYYAWTNAGSISHAPGATVNLGGVFQTSALAGLGLDASDTVHLTGTLNNSGSTLALGSAATPGPWNFLGGRIYHGDITTTPGAELIGGFNYYGGTLDGVQLDGTLDMGPLYGVSATIINGMVLNGQILVGGPATSYGSSNLYFGNYYDTAGQTLSGTGSVVFGNGHPGNFLTNASPYALTVGPGITIQGGYYSAIYGAIDNQGTIEDKTLGGGLYLDGSQLANYSGGTLTGGTWEVANAGLTLYKAPITTNAATIVLDGIYSVVYTDSQHLNAFAGLASNAAGASLTVTNGAQIRTATAFTNDGVLDIGPGGQFVTAGDFTQTAGGVLAIEIAGSQVVLYRQLVVAGVATPGGTLDVLFTNGFTPSAGDAFPILTFGSRSGASDFATYKGAAGVSLTPVYTPHDLTLVTSTVSSNSVTAVSAQTVSALQNVPTGYVLLATFTQGVNGSAVKPASAYSASIDWGDGSAVDSTNVQIALDSTGTQILVYGSHTYASGSVKSLSVTLTDGQSSAVATPTVIVANRVQGRVDLIANSPGYSQSSGLYSSTLKIKNETSTAIVGTQEIVLQKLTDGASLVSATVKIGGVTYSLSISYTAAGDPVITLPKSLMASLASGASYTLSLQFSAPAHTKIKYAAALYSDPYSS